MEIRELFLLLSIGWASSQAFIRSEAPRPLGSPSPRHKSAPLFDHAKHWPSLPNSNDGSVRKIYRKFSPRNFPDRSRMFRAGIWAIPTGMLRVCPSIFLESVRELSPKFYLFCSLFCNSSLTRKNVNGSVFFFYFFTFFLIIFFGGKFWTVLGEVFWRFLGGCLGGFGKVFGRFLGLFLEEGKTYKNVQKTY